MIKISKIDKKAVGKAALIFSSMALAVTLGAESVKVDDVATSATGTMKAVGSAFSWFVALFGAFCTFMGIIGLKNYADDSRQNPLVKPIIYFIAAALALGFTTTTGIFTKTVVGSEQQNTEVFEAK